MITLTCVLITLLTLLGLAELIDVIVPRPFRLVAEIVCLGVVGWVVVCAVRGVLELVVDAESE